MSFADTITARMSSAIEARTTRRGFLGRTAFVGSALTVAGPTYVLRPGTAYAQLTSRVRCADCGGSGLCCDGYTEFCCHLSDDGDNQCPPGTLLAGWWKVDRSDFCFGTARYYMDCNKAEPDCACGQSGSCQDDPDACGCTDCQSRKDSCTQFRYGNCSNHVACVGPIVCRVVTCTKPWEVEPSCSQVPRTDERTRNHHRPCLERDPNDAETAFVRALYRDFLGRASDATGEAYWGNRLVRGAHLDTGVRDVIADSFAFSDEYVGFVVDEGYRAAFDRPADDSGKAYWRGRLQGDLTPSDLAVALFSSQEFYDRSGRDLGRFLERLVERVLRRSITADERTRWRQRIESGTPVADVVRSVYDSEESRGVRVDDLYDRFLGRAADANGRRYWVGVLATREDLSLALFLAASDEYYDRALVRFPPPADPTPEPDPDPGGGGILDTLGLGPLLPLGGPAGQLRA